MKVLVVSQHYPPDLGAVSFRYESLVNELVKRNHQVYVLKANPNRYMNYQHQAMTYDGYHVNSVEINPAKNTAISKIKGFMFFYFKVQTLTRFYQNEGVDVVVSTTPYLLEGLAGQKLAKKIKAKHVLDVRDLWPDTAIALNKIKKNGVVAIILRYLEKKLYSRATRMICTSPGYVDHIKNITKSARVDVVMNGIDQIFKVEDFKNLTLNQKKLKILYAGNIGIAQNILTLIKAAKMLNKDIFEFEIIGSGTQLSQIEQFLHDEKLTNVTIKPPMDRRDLIKRYQQADVLFLQLHANEYFNKVVPSKIFEYLVTNKPIIYGLEGVSDTILKAYPGTYKYPPDDVSALGDVLTKVITEISHQKINRDCKDLYRAEKSKKFADLIERDI